MNQTATTQATANPTNIVNLPAPSPNRKPAPAKPKEIKRGGRQVRHLAQSVILEETGTSALVRLAMFVTCAAITLLIAWAALTRVQEVAVTQGTVTPASRIQDLQHLEGGIVQQIMVQDGQMVEAGQPLIRLQPAQATSELEQMRARQAGLTLKVERLRAFVENRQPDFSMVGKGYEALAQDQINILRSQIATRESGEAVIFAQIEQRRSEIRLYEDQLKSVDEQVKLLDQELAMREELLSKGLVSKVVYLDNKRELARVKGEKSRIQGQIGTAIQALAEVRQRLADLRAQTIQKSLDEVGVSAGELAQVQESLLKLEDRVNRLDIIASTRGLVQGLMVKTIGAVVAPGAIIGQIIPIADKMEVEAKISTKDIGHINVGQSVAVKVATYDYARFGAIVGTLTGISPTTYLDAEGNPYYKGQVELSKNYAGADPKRNHVLPGMTVQADVITGEKTLLEYLLKPVYVALNSSFQER
jgi:HlyD family secretion protein/adhesin transport system membrane fusion protein